MDPRDEKLLNTFQLLLVIVILMVLITKGCGVENTCKPIGCVEENNASEHQATKQSE